MKAECLIENVEKICALIGKILPVNPTLPILSHIKITADANNLCFSATDLGLGVLAKIPAKIEQEGETTVPGKQFLEVIGSFPKDKLTLSLEKDNLLLQVREHKVLFQTLVAEEFPSLFSEKGEKLLSLSEEELRDAFLRSVFCVSFDEARPVLSGILLFQKEKDFHVVSTDGYRMSFKKIKGVLLGKGVKKMIVSARLINEALFLKRKIDVFLYAQGNQLIFDAGDVVLVGRLIEGEYPDYERVVPQGHKTRITLNREEFLRILKLSSVFARESAYVVRFSVKNDVLTVSTRSSGLGEGEFKQEVEQEGEGGEIVFNIKFVMDFLRNVSSETVSMEMGSSFEPGVFKLPDDPSFLHVIMPVRVQE